MMREPVHQGRRPRVIREEAAPLRELQVGGEDEAARLVAVGHHPEQELGAVAVDRDIPPLVEDQEVGVVEVLLQAFERTGPVGFAEAEHQVGDGEEADGMPLLTRPTPKAVARWLFPVPTAP